MDVNLMELDRNSSPDFDDIIETEEDKIYKLCQKYEKLNSRADEVLSKLKNSHKKKV